MPSSNHQPDLDPGHSVHPRTADPEVIELGPLVEALLASLPEFLANYRGLVEACDDDPGEPAVLMELADFVAVRLASVATERSVLERALGVIESLIDGLADDEVGSELVGLAFFDSFSPEDRRLLAPWLGPRSQGLLEALDVSPAE